MEMKVDMLPKFVAFCDQEKTTAEAVLRSFMRDVLAVYVRACLQSVLVERERCRCGMLLGQTSPLKGKKCVRAKMERVRGHVGRKPVAKRWCVRGNGQSTRVLVSGISVLYNRQLHDEERAAIKSKANGNKAEEDKLTRAACYAVKCWAEYKPGSEEYTANYVSQLEASELGPELAWVDLQKEAGLFDYTPGQKITDMVKNDPLGTAKDAVKVALGGVTAKTGATICATTGAGCATAGGWMFAFGLSDMAEAAASLYNRYNGINSPGTNPLRYGFNQVTPIWGDAAYDAANLTFSIAALKAPVPLKMGTADGLNRPGSMFDVSVPRINNATLIPLLNQALPHGTTQGILLFGVGSKSATVINDIRDVGEKK